MAERWFVLQAGKSVGPLPFERLQQLASSGRLKPEDSIRLEVSECWQKAKLNPKIQFAVQITSDAHPSVPSPSRVSGSVPMGRVVANSLQPRTIATAAEIPKGRVVSSQPSEAPAFISAPAPSRVLRQTSPGATNRGPVYLMIGGIAVCLLGSVGILFAIGAFSNSTSSQVAEAKPKSPARAEATATSASGDAEAEAAAALNEIAPEPAKAKLNAKSDKSETTKTVKQPTLKIKRWSDVSKGASLTNGSISVKVASSHLAKDEAGTPITADSEEAKFLVVELDVSVKAGAAPVSYSGWQEAAILLDAKGNELSRAGVPSDNQARSKKLRPGEKLNETLTFAINSADLESFRLALPVAQVGIKDDRHFAFEIPKHALGRAEPETAAAPSIAARRTSSDDEPGEIMETMPPATSLASDPGKMDPKKREEIEFEKERERLRKTLQMDEEPAKDKAGK